ncbi:MAG TPA: ribonuclease Z [Candidatus Binatia bacterium]|jgi:ribonuclease Z|nr:ribonuclease Z [Candidatus Binatia bacterium]
MSLTFAARLVNGPFGDPGLYIDLRWEGRALLFDLGHNDALPPAELLRVSHVFVSHCHMDHFIGFDRLLRLFLARDKKLYLFGPPGILACVEGKLQGYTWNLVDEYDFAIEVAEVAPDGIRRLLFRAATGFVAEELSSLPFNGTLVDEPGFCVRTAHLDHRIYSLGFVLEEKSHLNVDKTELDRLGVPAGPWLTEVKRALRRGEPDAWVITARWRLKNGQEQSRDFALGDLRERLVKETPGQKIAYVVDTLYSPENVARIAELAHDADLFFCESPFLDVDEDQATRRYHLTARQAGLLGRAAQAKKLVVFHFSPRYSGQAGRIYQEAQEVFRGTEESNAVG